MMHYTFAHGTSYRFETKQLAEKYSRVWPGTLGPMIPVEASIYEPPVWSICDNPRTSVDLILYVENTSIPVRFV